MEPQAINENTAAEGGVDDEIAQMAMEGDPNTDESAIDPNEAAVNAAWLSANIAENFDDEKLKEISKTLLEHIAYDEGSRAEWAERVDGYAQLAAQVVQHKSFPWSNASNIKYPLLTMAALQFQSRAYKGLIRTNNIAKCRVMGRDDSGLKALRAKNISQHMSYQLLEEMPAWEEELDTLLMVLPIVGNVFRKTYFNGEIPISELVLPQNLVVNYYAASLEKAERKTHIIGDARRNDIIGYMRTGFFREVDIDLERTSQDPEGLAEAIEEGQGLVAPSQDDQAPYTLLECHCYLDLDEDGYEEPYKVTIIKELEEVVRISARYVPSGILQNTDGDIVKITEIEEFTNFRFMPDINSGVYGLGFGHILGPLNEAANTLINQLVDSGTLNNLPSGFLARGVRIRSGEHPLEPGEFRYVSSTGDDLRKGIFPMPIKPPSSVLFSLLTFLAETGMSLASVTEIMRGENPGQNQPYSTTKEVLEQGMSVYTSIYKRIFRALKKEFQKLYVVNRYYLPPQVYFAVLDSNGNEGGVSAVRQTDYQMDEIDVLPTADPNQVSDVLEIAKAEQLMPLVQLGIVNPQVAGKRLLLAQDHENVDELLDVPKPEPTIDQQIEIDRLAMEKERGERETDVLEMKVAYQAARDEASSTKIYTESLVMQMQMEVDRAKQEFEQALATAKLELDAVKAELDAAASDREMSKQQAHEKEMQTTESSNESKSKTI